ncbi:MAG: ribonuclease HII [Kiritimatiellae bacterium]|nr:ribonuclease HII [Kiritimatiellia bacterium]
MLEFERNHWLAYPGSLLAGVDEVGRGPLAGPVFAAAVHMPRETAETLYAGPLRDLTDSKQLSATRREYFHAFLLAAPDVRIGIGSASVAEIDEVNILCATHLAMRRAVLALPPPAAEHVLVDGLPVRGLPCPSTAIVQGDCKSLLIAAASVVAKVVRDRHMRELDALYPAYAFASNKGYGSHAHVVALLRHGPSPVHRRSFRPVQDAWDARLPLPPAEESATG